jgi:hypothetical protein
MAHLLDCGHLVCELHSLDLVEEKLFQVLCKFKYEKNHNIIFKNGLPHWVLKFFSTVL